MEQSAKFNSRQIFRPYGITALQDAHKRLVLQVYLRLNTLEFSAIYIGFVVVAFTEWLTVSSLGFKGGARHEHNL